MNGHMVRSRLQLLQNNEKPSKFFCSLENKYYTDKKTIKCIITKTDKVINEQSAILKEVKEFYKYLFDQNEANFDEVELKTLLANFKINTLNNIQKLSLEGSLIIQELGQALKP